MKSVQGRLLEEYAQAGYQKKISISYKTSPNLQDVLIVLVAIRIRSKQKSSSPDENTAIFSISF